MEGIMIVAGASLLGGFVQSVTGFGAAIIIMIFLPMMMSMTAAPAASDVITMTLSFAMCWRYRKYVKVRKIVMPALVYMGFSLLAIRQSSQLDGDKLKLIFGIFLVILSCYFLMAAGKVKLRASAGMGVICAAIAGVCGGFFGISGPPASLYYLAVTDSKEEYLGSLNGMFSIVVIFNIISRVMNGFITTALLPYMFIGALTIQIGCVIGSRVVGRISMDMLKRCVYILMLFAGMISVMRGLGI